MDVHYIFKPSEAETQNVFLHGWGRDLSDFRWLSEEMSGGLYVDLPPFGLSGKVKDWSIFTYANLILCLVRHLKIKKINLIGHSFGGRIAIIVAGMEKNLVQKLVLIASAGMKPKRSFKYRLKVASYKILKKFGLKTKSAGSRDYQKLDDDMKKIFVSVVNTHLEDNARLIECKTLLIWGKNDEETPIYMAKRLNRLIKNSQLDIMENCGHFCFLERKIAFQNRLKDFLEV